MKIIWWNGGHRLLHSSGIVEISGPPKTQELDNNIMEGNVPDVKKVERNGNFSHRVD
jgi:hypothetical protein